MKNRNIKQIILDFDNEIASKERDMSHLQKSHFSVGNVKLLQAKIERLEKEKQYLSTLHSNSSAVGE
ncbi:MAG: hypothetical protein GF401_17590 [Chitinivibrionales bacterium]|nr:hypothetical protein [Chitinivibrionales bacterium]